VGSFVTVLSLITSDFTSS